jgi:uncharacterized glyoxalase superfamily protein PhnB
VNLILEFAGLKQVHSILDINIDNLSKELDKLKSSGVTIQQQLASRYYSFLSERITDEFQIQDYQNTFTNVSYS